jgi:hypothetical protein
MNTSFSKITLILMLLAVLLAGCGGIGEKGPEEAYWAYHEACQSGAYETAQQFLTAEARKRSLIIGVCSFAHDAVSDTDIANGITERTFSTDPEVNIAEDAAVLTWIDDMGIIVSIFMEKTENGWMVAEILRSI